MLFSTDLTKSSFDYSVLHIFIYILLSYVNFSVHNTGVILLAINMAPTLSTLTVTKSITEIFMPHSN